MKLSYGKLHGKKEEDGRTERKNDFRNAGPKLERLKARLVLPLAAAAAFSALALSSQGCVYEPSAYARVCALANQDKQAVKTKGETFTVKTGSGNTYVFEVVDVVQSEFSNGQIVNQGYIKVNVYAESEGRIIEEEQINEGQTKDIELSGKEKVTLVVCEIRKIADNCYAVIGFDGGALETPEIDGSDGGVEDGGVDAGDEIPDGGDETVDGGVDAGDEIPDGGDEGQDGGQTCEAKTECNAVGTPETFFLFNVNGENITETKKVKQCVQTNEDCSTEVVEDAIELTLSRPLTPAEQQLFSTHYTLSALNLTTQYDTTKRQFGTQFDYKPDLKEGETLKGLYCRRIIVLPDGRLSVRFLYNSTVYDVNAGDPPMKIGDNKLYAKVYYGGSIADGAPVAVFSDLKEAKNTQTVEIGRDVYDVTINVDPANSENLAGMKLTRK